MTYMLMMFICGWSVGVGTVLVIYTALGIRELLKLKKVDKL